MHLRFLLTNQINSYIATASSSATTAMTDTAINSVSTAGSSTLLQDVVLSSFTSNPLMIGTAWMISSAIFTTYSTTKFIKYKKPTTVQNSDGRQYPFWLPQQQHLMDRLRPFQKRLQRYNPVTKKLSILQWPSNSQTKKTYKQLESSSRNSLVQQQEQRQGDQAPAVSATRILSPSSVLTMYRFAGSLVLGLLFSTSGGSANIPQRFYDTLATIPTLLIPSICLFIANFSNTIALDRIGIGLTYTSKCGIPIITVLLTLFLDGVAALPNIPTLISLIPIAFGIAAASWSAPTYEMLGFIMACISATAQSALNVTSKRALAKAKLSGPIGQRTMVAVGLLFTVLINMIQITMTTVQRQRELSQPSSNQKNLPIESNLSKRRTTTSDVATPPLWLTLMAMVAYHVEYLLSFIFVTLVGPITYGTCDAIRRLCIILFGRMFFGGDPFTNLNKIGIATALVGALSYSILNSTG